MKKLYSSRRIILLLPLVFAAIITIVIIPMKQAIVFEYQNSGKVLAYIPLNKDNQFKIKYTHSIHLSDVIESYKVTSNNKIQQYELMYEDFAIGMPEGASEGEVFEQKNGKYYIKNMTRIFPHFDLRTGKVRANHRIIFKQNEYPLFRTIKPGTWVRIKIRKINLIEQLEGVNIIEH